MYPKEPVDGRTGEEWHATAMLLGYEYERVGHYFFTRDSLGLKEKYFDPITLRQIPNISLHLRVDKWWEDRGYPY